MRSKTAILHRSTRHSPLKGLRKRADPVPAHGGRDHTQGCEAQTRFELNGQWGGIFKGTVPGDADAAWHAGIIGDLPLTPPAVINLKRANQADVTGRAAAITAQSARFAGQRAIHPVFGVMAR